MSAPEEIYPGVDELRLKLLKAIQKVDEVNSAASFSCCGTVKLAPNPGIGIEGLGVIGLPLSIRDADLLISKCRESPFGKGEQTLVDPSIRKYWELDASQFSLSNPEWTSFMTGVLDIVHKGLGLSCHRASMHAELYKLLIYEEGAFFKPHKDSEKTSGMFGTMVVCLPSIHQGGRVSLVHNKRTLDFNTAESSAFSTSFAAWYSHVLHEVERVTSGHRVVLTYNLVQQSSLMQRAPDPDTRVEVLEALSLWERALADNEDDYPPYFMHRLEHFYSKVSANIDMLKGNDAAQVRCLESACHELDFGVYLGVFEKTIYKDDGLGDEEVNREEAFGNLTHLNGKPAQFRTTYDPDYRLEAYDSDEDRDADESEHEGYTGNEGAPATYWYRQTVLLLVPPSRKIEFGLSGENKFALARDRLKDLNLKAADDVAAGKQLFRLCHTLLPTSATAYPSYSAHTSIEKSDRDDCYAQIAEIALKHDRVDLFSRVPMGQKSAPHCLDTLGTFLHHRGLGPVRHELIGMIKHAVNIADKFKLLQAIRASFNKACPNSSNTIQRKAEFEAWYEFAFRDILDTQERATKDDGATLGQIARTSDEDVRDRISHRLRNASSQTLAAFVMTFTRENPNLSQSAESAVVQEFLERLWQNFHYAQSQSTYEATVEALNQYELADLLDLTKSYSQVGVPGALAALSSALKGTDKKYLHEILLPLVVSIMNHTITSVIVEDDTDLFDAVSTYIQLVLCTYIWRHVWAEPLEPRDWALPFRGCGRCTYCDTVAAFMNNAMQNSWRQTFPKRAMKHLELHYGLGERRDFHVRIDQTTRPPSWVCTKNHNSWKQAHSEWKKIVQQTHTTLESIGGKDMMHLKTYLGENFEPILSCQIENLPDMASKALSNRQPLSNVDASSLNVSNGRKRGFDISEVAGTDDRAAKRTRPAPSELDPADVIDLT